MHVPINWHHTKFCLALNSSFQSLLIPCPYFDRKQLEGYISKFVFGCLCLSLSYNSLHLLMFLVPKTLPISSPIKYMKSNSLRCFGLALNSLFQSFSFLLLWLKTTWRLHKQVCLCNFSEWGRHLMSSLLSTFRPTRDNCVYNSLHLLMCLVPKTHHIPSYTWSTLLYLSCFWNQVNSDYGSLFRCCCNVCPIRR